MEDSGDPPHLTSFVAFCLPRKKRRRHKKEKETNKCKDKRKPFRGDSPASVETSVSPSLEVTSLYT